MSKGSSRRPGKGYEEMYDKIFSPRGKKMPDTQAAVNELGDAYETALLRESLANGLLSARVNTLQQKLEKYENNSGG